MAEANPPSTPNEYVLSVDKNMTIRPAPSIFNICVKEDSPKPAIAFFREANLLSNSQLCEKCKKNMKIINLPFSKNRDMESWKCGSCGKQISIRFGSFWFVSNFIYMYALYSVIKTFIKMYRFYFHY